MHFLATFVSALSCLSFATQAVASPHQADPAALSNIFIMRQAMDYSQGALPIYAPNGTVAYRFIRSIHDPITGSTTILLKDLASGTLNVMESSNSLCAHKTTYSDMELPVSQGRQFTIDPDGLLKDQWSFSYLDITDTQQNFKFDRNYASKEGKIYHQFKGKNGALVAELRNQKRTDSWITTPSVHEVDTYTLSCADNSPQVDLVFLMGLVMTRVHDCGL
ncbi:hypothetical protein PGTUg99_028974 [Puccinia graminis f. sp. tritici]|uniref:Uncharacterized protein n=1 Tax=Puccinia graminis f. sp. tritici TaxID=56615 RepID=A0A5B0PGR4_PUCGR|nr:hypothetical protein PGTUg99_028974 [Puccinia graminis f. sp. tritici]